VEKKSPDRIKHIVKSMVREEVLRESARKFPIDRETDRQTLNHYCQKYKAVAETTRYCLSSQAALHFASFPLKTLLIEPGCKTA